MPTNKQRREAARRHLERQQQRRQQRELSRRRWLVILTVAGVLVIGAVVAIVVVAFHNDDKKTSAHNSTSASTSPSPSPTVSHTPLPARKPAKIAARAARKTHGPCGYAESASTLKSNPNLFDVGLPPDPARTPTTKHTAVFATNRGDITVQLDGASAPCNVQSLDYLIGKKFFDGSACPRSVDQGIHVLQCGDPTATTGGGPTYTVKDENLSKADYTAGTLAMANSGANTNGSQFFFIVKDSNADPATGAGLEKKYTVVGHVTKGLDILQKVVAAGDDGSNQAGGGRPNQDVIVKTVRLEASNG